MTALSLGPTVLMYHGFHADQAAPYDPYDLHVRVDDLAAQLHLLAQLGWIPLDLDGYLRTRGRRGVRRSYLVTIDDALRSVALAAPVLARAGVPSVLFVPPALVGRTASWLPLTPDEPLLDADELRALARDGMEMGVHGLDHTSMTGMDDTQLQRHVIGARDAVADLTGVRPRSFAYPYGDVDERARSAVRAAGFDVAFSVFADAGPFAVSRTDVKPGDSLTAVRVKLAAGSRYRLVWRAVGVAKPFRSTLRRFAQAR